MSSPLEEFPLDDVELDVLVNDVLNVPGVSSYTPEDGPGIRYSKFIPLDSDKSRMIEFFAESCLCALPRNLVDGYSLDEVKTTTGVMMRRVFGRAANGMWRTVSQYVPSDRFIEEFLVDPAVKIRAYRWFADNANRAAIDEESLESINTQFLPKLIPLAGTDAENPFRTAKDIN